MTDDQVLLDQLLAEAGFEGEPALPRLHARARPQRLPLSFAQELLWLLDNASPGMTAYNMPIVRRIRGPLDVRALERSINAVAARHESLRTRFAPVEGEPSQLIDPPRPFALEVIDLKNVAEDERTAPADDALRQRAGRPFDLAREHMLRATLVRLHGDDHLLLFVLHHIIADGASLGILFAELQTFYHAFRAGQTLEIPPLDIQYADYALWQREVLSGERLQTLLTYWRRQLGERTEPLDVPTDYQRAAMPTFGGVQRSRLLAPELAEGLTRLARTKGATLYMAVLAAYATLLHRYTGRPNILIGSNVAGRMESGTENLIGYFNNTLAMRADFTGDPSFSTLLERVRENCLGAFDHQDVPFEKLVLELRAGERRLAGAPLFDVVLSAQNPTAPSLALDGLQVTPYAIDVGTTKFDLTLFMAESPEGLRLVLRARSDLWSAASVERMLAQLHGIAEAVTERPGERVSRLPIVSAAEAQLVASENASAADLGSGSVIAAFEAQAARRPDVTALVCGAHRLAYRELDRRAAALAHRLRERGVEPGTPIGLAAERTVSTVVALLGILKAGAAYVPFEPGVPAERLVQQFDESGTQLIVADARDVALLSSVGRELVLIANGDVASDASAVEASAAEANAAETPHADGLAYVIFTSGSTGVPKGVAVTHANLSSYVRAISRVLADIPANVPGEGFAALEGLAFAMTGTFAADLGHTTLFTALCSGGTLHLLPPDVTNDPLRFANYVDSQRLDIVKITPSHLRALHSGGDGARGLPARWLVLGGEALGLDFAAELLAFGRCRVLNHYGPTETTVGATTFEVTAASLASARAAGARSVPIGRPLAGVQALVFDANLEPVPLGVPGELVICGRGVANGYLNRPEFTAQSFIDVAQFGRAYRTGDRVRRLADGALEFLGRADAQVKIRGYRVDLGDVEHALRRYPGVAECAVVTRDDAETGEPSILAYVAPHGEATPEQLREWLAERLPEYMVPSRVTLLAALPRNASGKVDKRALSPDAGVPPDAYAAPRTPTERTLASIWAEVLRRERVGVQEPFLDIGGHSLSAIRILGKLSRTFGIRLPLRALFEAPTIERLAAVVDAASASRDADDLGPVPRAPSGNAAEAAR